MKCKCYKCCKIFWLGKKSSFPHTTTRKTHCNYVIHIVHVLTCIVSHLAFLVAFSVVQTAKSPFIRRTWFSLKAFWYSISQQSEICFTWNCSLTPIPIRVSHAEVCVYKRVNMSSMHEFDAIILYFPQLYGISANEDETWKRFWINTWRLWNRLSKNFAHRSVVIVNGRIGQFDLIFVLLFFSLDRQRSLLMW